MIVLFHFGYRGPATAGWTPAAYPEIAWLAQEMWAGVSFFFIISGFVIAWSAERRDALAFLTGRAARLYPAFLACMTVTAVAMAVAAPAGVEEFRMSLARWAANLPLISKAFGQPFVDGAYWSIVIEVIFYGWVGVFLATGHFHRRQLTLLAIWLAVAFANELVLGSKALQALLITKHAGYFVLGIIAYRIHASERRPSPVEVALCALALALCVLDDRAYALWMTATLGYAAPWSPAFALGKLALMLLVLAVAIRLPPVFSPRLCLAVGGLTYPLYLVHQNLGYVLMHAIDPLAGRWGALAIATGTVILLAWLVHRHVEPPGKRLVLGAADALRARLLAPAGFPRRG